MRPSLTIATLPVHRGLHRLACFTVGVTLLLIFVGGVVTNTGSALAVPDWPTTFGHNMFLYPWASMVGGIFYEHSHRLLGSVVGLLTVSLAVWVFVVEDRRWVKGMAAAAVVGVIIQGVLGGLRVVLLADAIAIVHGCLAQAFLSLMVGLAVVTSPWWRQRTPLEDREEAAVLRFRAFATAAAFYVQIVFGAWLTHTGGRLDVHLMFAGIATFATMAVSARILAAGESTRALHSIAKLMLALLIVQLTLGMGAAIVRFTAPGEQFSPTITLAFPIFHRLVGAMLVASAMALAWRVGGLSRARGDSAEHKESIPSRLAAQVGGARGAKAVA